MLVEKIGKIKRIDNIFFKLLFTDGKISVSDLPNYEITEQGG